jgi:hypothetical protein
MVVVSDAALKRPGGDRFAKAIIAAYYEVNRSLSDPATHEATLLAIGAKFMQISDVRKMETIIQQTRFYSTSDQGIAVFKDASLMSVMGKVTTFCTKVGLCVDAAGKTVVPSIGYDAHATDKAFRFDTSFMEAVRDGK